MTDGTDGDEAKIQDTSLIFRSRRFLLWSVWVQRFGRGWLTAEGATPQKFSLPHLFTCRLEEDHHHHCLHDGKGQQELLGALCSPEDTVAPEEDMDMDLDVDRQVLLSLPVTNTLYDAVLFRFICFYKLLINQRRENE